MAFWLGVMRLAERAGLVQRIARGLRPVMRRLFPDVPPEHPAMGSMLMNMAANSGMPHRAAGDVVRRDRRHHFGKNSGEAAVLSFERPE